MTNVKQPNERVWLDRGGERINIDRAWQKSDQRIALSRREQAMLAAAGLDGPESRWYVLLIRPGCDKAVDKALADANVECWMPVILVPGRRSRGRPGPSSQTVEAPALPGYLFVRVVSTDATWAAISAVEGVSGVIGGASCPAFVHDDKVLKLKADLADDPRAIEILTNAIRLGETVRIDHGPFAAHAGVVERIDADGRLAIEVMLFGRGVSMELGVDQVSRSI